MINPYAQPPPVSYPNLSQSPEECLKKMIRHHNPTPLSVDSLRSILDHVMMQPNIIQWTENLVKDLSIFVLDLLEPFVPLTDGEAHVPEEILATLALLNTSMETWDHDLVYLSLVQEHEDSKSRYNLLDLLVDMTMYGYGRLRQIALVGLSTAYRSMDRLHRHLTLDPCRPDKSWWLNNLTVEKVHTLTSVCVGFLIRSNDDFQKTDDFQPSKDQIQCAAMSLLCVILRRDQWYRFTHLDVESLPELCRALLRYLQTIMKPQLPQPCSRWLIVCALVSASLLPLIRWRHDFDFTEFDGILGSTTILKNVIDFAFPLAQENDGSISIPQKGDYEINRGLQLHALDTIHSWALSGNVEWSGFLNHSKIWRGSIEQFWTDCFDQESHKMRESITCIMLLHHACPLIAKGALSSALQTYSANSDINTAAPQPKHLLTALFDLFGETKFAVRLQAVFLARILLSDRNKVTAHDEVSREVWRCVDDVVLDRVFDWITLNPMTQEAIRPLLLATLDLLDTLLQDQDTCCIALKSLTSKRLEHMIGLVTPTTIKFDYKDPTDWGDLSLDVTSETPPANNLSRMDENSICIEHEDQTILRGVDSTIEVSCATVLARLAYNPWVYNENGIHLLKSRASTIVNDYISHSFSKIGANDSFDMSKRSFRLQIVVAAAENEDFVVTTLFTAEILRQKHFLDMKQDKESTERKLQDALQRSQDLERQIVMLSKQMNSQAIVFKRELSRIQENASHDAKQLVTLHANERANAEKLTIDCTRKLEQTKERLQSIQLQGEELQCTVKSTKDELQRAVEATTDLQKQNKELARLFDDEKAKTKNLEVEIQSQMQKLDLLVRRHQALEDDIHERNRTIDDSLAANDSLRDNLEELFADMVSLATVYEAKENEVVQLNRKHHDTLERTESKLSCEVKRNEELNSTVDQLRRENEKLYQKLAKYKERLEDERRGRQEEANRRKRNGPVSYINQLHQSTTSDKSIRDRSSIRTDVASSKSQTKVDKENKYIYGESQRRTFY